MRHGITVLLALALGLAATGCIPSGPPPTPTPQPRFFDAQQQYPTGLGPVGLAVHDFNNDGRRDVAVAARDEGIVTVALAAEDTFFPANTPYPVGPEPVDLIAVDLTGDGIRDLLAVLNDPPAIAVLPGLAGGTFGAALTFALPAGSDPLTAVAGEFVGDASVDVAVATAGSNGVALLRGRGDGTFTAAGTLPTGGGVRGLAAADLDADGDTDLVALSIGVNELAWLRNEGAGVFSVAVAQGVGTDPRDVVLADFDGDTLADAVVANPGSGDFSFLRGDAATGFASETRFEFDGLPTRLTSGDYDGDGNRDFAAIRFREGGTTVALGMVAVFYGNGDGTFSGPRLWGAREQALNAVTADLDDDNRPDLLTANTNTNDWSWLRGRGDGSFETDERLPAGNTPRALAVADLNRDNDNDLVVGNLNDNTLSVLLGRGDGTFEAEQITNVPGNPRALVAGFFDGDNDPDIAVASVDTSRVFVLLGRGDGTFDPPTVLGVRTPDQASDGLAAQPRGLDAGDIDDDGNTDLIVALSNFDVVAVLYGDGMGGFSQPVQFFASNFPNDVRLEDMNGDGALDFITVNSIDPTPGVGSPRVNVVFGDGMGGFNPATRRAVSAPGIPRSLLVADLDSDGDFDAATGNEAADAEVIGVLAGDGDGELNPGTARGTGQLPATVAAGLIDADGRLDLVTTNGVETISVLLNEGGLSYADPIDYAVGRDPIDGRLADVNGDGVLDYITPNRRSEDVSVLLGRP